MIGFSRVVAAVEQLLKLLAERERNRCLIADIEAAHEVTKLKIRLVEIACKALPTGGNYAEQRLLDLRLSELEPLAEELCSRAFHRPSWDSGGVSSGEGDTSSQGGSGDN